MINIFKNKNNFGFTLIEITVVLGVVVVLAILILSGYSEGRSRLAVERTVESFVSDLHRSRQRGFFGVGYDINGDILGADGHGIRIIKEHDYYVLYVKSATGEEETEEIRIEELVKIENITVAGDNNRPSVKIFFEKGGEVKINGGILTPAENVIIRFSAKKDSSIQRNVAISNKGITKIIYD